MQCVYIYPQIPSTNGWCFTTTWPGLKFSKMRFVFLFRGLIFFAVCLCKTYVKTWFNSFCIAVNTGDGHLASSWPADQLWSCTPLTPPTKKKKIIEVHFQSIAKLRQAGFQPRAVCHVLFLRPLTELAPWQRVIDQLVDRPIFFFAGHPLMQWVFGEVFFPERWWFPSIPDFFQNWSWWKRWHFWANTFSCVLQRIYGFPCEKHDIWFQDVWGGTFGITASD